MLKVSSAGVEFICTECRSTITRVDLAVKGLPVPAAALVPLLTNAVNALKPDFAGCALLCADCVTLNLRTANDDSH